MRYTPCGTSVHLFGGFDVVVEGRRVTAGITAQHVVALLAIHERSVPREYAAGRLWPDVDEERAAANLRTTLWRLQRSSALVARQGGEIMLRPEVRVDLTEAKRACRVLESRDAGAAHLESVQALLECTELLPGWYEDWVVTERERFRQLRLHTLEVACETLTAWRLYAQAIQVGLAAVAAEPLRETAHAVLVKAYLAEGNFGEAVRQFRMCCSLMRTELGIEPSRELAALVDPFNAPRTQSWAIPPRPSSIPAASNATTASTGIPAGTRMA